MTAERDAWERLVTLGTLAPDSFYSPKRAKEGWYSATLKAKLKDLDLQPTPQTSQDTLRRKPTTADLLAAIDREADRLLQTGSEVAPADRVIHLRELSRELGLSLRDGDLQRRIWDARRRAAGTVQMLEPGMAVEAPDAIWAWEGLLMAGDTNLVVASPKLGKTTLVVAAIASWHYGMPGYLGQAFHGPCPAVVLLGTDMPRSRWMPLLGRFGLAEKLEDGRWRLRPDGPIRGLFTQTEALYLDPAGLGRIADVVAQHPGCLLLADSYAKLIAPLGLKEGDASFAGPLGDLQEVVAPYGVTLVPIHHAGHARKGEGAVAACRGSTALPAAVSQVIGLSWFNRSSNKSDRRVLLETEGRGESLQLLIEQHDTGWTCIGDAATACQELAQAEAEQKLSDRQAEVLELCRERSQQALRTDAAAVTKALEIPLRQARRTLQQLEHRGFLDSRKETTDTGQVVWFSA